MKKAKIDKIFASILQRRLKSITEEMSIALARTTRSPILCEAKDFVTGLYDSNGKMLEQCENLPILAFSLSPVCQYIINFFTKENIEDGDVIFHNDVFSFGNQNNDVAVFKPIFWENKLIAWAACKGHQADIGGAVRGGYNPQATEVWQEALRIPPVKVYEKGMLKKDVWNLIFSNIRLDIVAEDMKASIGSCIIGERGIHKILKRYGKESFKIHKKYLFNSTEKIMRSEIKNIPNGIYKGKSNVYYDGHTPNSKFNIKVEITVKNDNISFDYNGTDPQTKGFVNGTYTSSASATLLTFLQMINPDIPHNHGMLRPIKIIIPKGSLLNASYPAATNYGNHLCPNNADAIMRALAPAIPNQVTAEWNELLCSLTTGIDPRKNDPYVDIGFMGLKGGSGAIKGEDGYDHIGMIDASGGVLDQDYEMFEQQTPHLLKKHEYWLNSGGPGQWRGGLGVITEYLIGSNNTQIVTFGDGDIEPALGSNGGKEGTLNGIWLNSPKNIKYKCTTKDLIKNVRKGTLYHQKAGGGGGYGYPHKRKVDKVKKDIINEKISPKKALEIYKIVFNKNNGIDSEKTKRIRTYVK